MRAAIEAGLAILMVCSTACAAPECTEERASYDPLVLCDWPLVPDDLIDLAATARGEGGLVVIGSLREAPVQTDPRLYPSSCGAGVCLSEARVSAPLTVSDALRDPGSTVETSSS
jgi:hypothetical protein